MTSMTVLTDSIAGNEEPLWDSIWCFIRRNGANILRHKTDTLLLFGTIRAVLRNSNTNVTYESSHQLCKAISAQEGHSKGGEKVQSPLQTVRMCEGHRDGDTAWSVCLCSCKGDSEVLGTDITSAGKRLGGQGAGYPTVLALQQHPFPSTFPSSQVQGEVIRGRMASSLCHYPPITCHPLWADNRSLAFPQLYTSLRSSWTVTPHVFLNPPMPLWFAHLLTPICRHFTLFLFFSTSEVLLKTPEAHVLSDLYLICIILRQPFVACISYCFSHLLEVQRNAVSLKNSLCLSEIQSGACRKVI